MDPRAFASRGAITLVASAALVVQLLAACSPDDFEGKKTTNDPVCAARDGGSCVLDESGTASPRPASEDTGDGASSTAPAIADAAFQDAAPDGSPAEVLEGGPSVHEESGAESPTDPSDATTRDDASVTGDACATCMQSDARAPTSAPDATVVPSNDAGDASEPAPAPCGDLALRCRPGEPDQARSESCGPCGRTRRSARRCKADGCWDAWSAWGECKSASEECTPGMMTYDARTCGVCQNGTQTSPRRCTDACTWGPYAEWGECHGSTPECRTGMLDQLWQLRPAGAPEEFEIVNDFSGLCLGVIGFDAHTAGDGVEVFDCGARPNDPALDQRWRVLGDRIQNVQSGYCLGVRGVDTPVPDSEVEVYHCEPAPDDPRQDTRWSIVRYGDGRVQLANGANSALCLGVQQVDAHGAGAKTEVWHCQRP